MVRGQGEPFGKAQGEYPVYIQFDKPSQSARLDNIILSESFTVFSAKSSLLVRNSQTFLLP